MERPRDPSLSRCNADRLLRLTCADLQYLRKLQEMVGKFKHKIGPKWWSVFKVDTMDLWDTVKVSYGL